MIYRDCWNEISAGNCIFSGHALNGDELRVFVERGLDVWAERLQRHVRSDGGSGVGQCTLVFGGVSHFQWRETPFTKSATGQVVWGEPVSEWFGERLAQVGEKYFLDGTTFDGLKSVWSEIHALSFAIEAQ